MKNSLLLIAGLLLKPCFSFAQKEANNWNFGWNGAITFANGSPAYVPGSQLVTSEGCASISDSSGSLLFYTDGITVYNKNNAIMANGTGLLGNSDATQAALIVKKPGSFTDYYIFAVTNEAHPDGITYSLVDMTLNAGLGGVTLKNQLLYTPSTEKLAATKHANGTDVWIITHDWMSDAFRCFLLTSAGIQPAVVSNAGMIHNGSTWNTNGYMKVSPDGKKIAVAVCHFINKFELFNFDNASGVVSYPVSFPTYAASIGAYGVEFSRDGSKLYGSMISPGTIYQFDLCAGKPGDIINSATIVATENVWICALQLGPDGKIYISRASTDSLGVINYPNSLGTACSYDPNGVYVGNNTANLGLPNFESSIFSFVNYYGSCTNDSTRFYLKDTSNVDSVSWSFDDPASGINNTSNLYNPAHLFSNSAIYFVQLIRFGGGIASDTSHFCVEISPCKVSVEEVIKELICTLSPNPGNGIFQITVKNIQADQTEMQLFDCTGKKVFDHSVFNPGTELHAEINLSGLKAGIYFMEISTGTFHTYQKVILY